MSTRQNHLPGVSRADHSNLGADFEAELDAVHHFYRLQRAADIRKIPHKWNLISEAGYLKLRQKLPASMLARTDDGKFMQRVKSDVDYLGGGRLSGPQFPEGRSFSLAFDAKSVRGARFPLANVEPHQLVKLRDRARCGYLAGLMVRFSEAGRVFFAGVDFVARRVEEMEKQKRGRRARAGTASIPLQDFIRFTIEIPPNPKNGLYDYLTRIVER